MLLDGFLAKETEKKDQSILQRTLKDQTVQRMEAAFLLGIMCFCSPLTAMVLDFNNIRGSAEVTTSKKVNAGRGGGSAWNYFQRLTAGKKPAELQNYLLQTVSMHVYLEGYFTEFSEIYFCVNMMQHLGEGSGSAWRFGLKL